MTFKSMRDWSKLFLNGESTNFFLAFSTLSAFFLTNRACSLLFFKQDWTENLIANPMFTAKSKLKSTKENVSIVPLALYP